MAINYKIDKATVVAASLLEFSQDVVSLTKEGYELGFDSVFDCPQLIGGVYVAVATRTNGEKIEVKVVTTFDEPTEEKVEATTTRRKKGN